MNLPLVSLVLALRPALVPADVPARHVAAHAITAAAVAEDGAPFRGPDRVALASAALVAIGLHESGFDGKVLSCARKGAAGELSAWQLLPGKSLGGYNARAVCEDPTLAGQLALRVLGRMPRATVGAALAAYVGGSPAHRRLVAKKRCKTYVRAARALGVKSASCGGAL